MGEDRTPPKRRTTVAEAAEVLGISAEAVRGRIRRGTLPVEREGGTVYVMLDEQLDDRTTDDQPRTTGDQPGDRTDLLIAELQDRVRSLEEANRENRRIIAALTSRIPAIEATSDALGSSETTTGASEDIPPRSRTGGPETATEDLSEAEPSLLWERVVVVILSALAIIPAYIALSASDLSFSWLYVLAGSMALAWVVFPAVFGFRYGRKVRSLRFWRKVVPVAALLGLGIFLLAPRFAHAALGIDFFHALENLRFEAALFVMFGGIPGLVYIFAALLGNALRRRTRENLVEVRPSDFSPAAVSGTQGWTSGQQAIVGLVGTIISSLIGLIGTILTVMASG